MKQRVITAIVALILFIPVIYLGGITIDVVASALAVIGISEIFIMRKHIIVSIEFVLAVLATLTMSAPNTFFKDIDIGFSRFEIFYMLVMLLLLYTVLTKNRVSFEDVGVIALAAIYIGTGFQFLAGVRNSAHGLALLGYVLVIVWSTDIGAYMIGRKIGKHKLWPAISPNKTWEGSIGGILAAIVFSLIYLLLIDTHRDLLYLGGMALLLSIAGQIGDLVESAYKRHYGVKDSGKILPGHGGILDRFDSLLFVLPLVAFFNIL